MSGTKANQSTSGSTSSSKKGKSTQSPTLKTDQAGDLWTLDAEEGKWARALYLNEYRTEVDLQETQYDHEPAKGREPGDITSYLKSQKSWGRRRENFPSILFEYHRRGRAKNPGDKVGFLQTTHKGQKVYLLNNDGYPIKDFKVLPMTLSTNLEGFRIEAYKRFDDRIKLCDLQDRMMPVWNPKKKALQIPQSNDLNMRMLRVRRIHRCLAWGVGGGTAFRQVMEHEMTKKMIKENTTKALRPLSKKEVAYLEQVGYGTSLDRAGAKRKLSDEERYAKWMQVSSLTKMGKEVTQDKFELATRIIRGVSFQVARIRNPEGKKALKARRVQDRIDSWPWVDPNKEELDDEDCEDEDGEDEDDEGENSENEIEEGGIIGKVVGEDQSDRWESQHHPFEPEFHFEQDGVEGNDSVHSFSHEDHQSSNKLSTFELHLAKIVASNARRASTIATGDPRSGSHQGRSVQGPTDQDTFDEDVQAHDEYHEAALEEALVHEPWRQDSAPRDTLLRRNGEVVLEYPDPLQYGFPTYYPDPNVPRDQVWGNGVVQQSSRDIYQDPRCQKQHTTASATNPSTQGRLQSKKRRLTLDDRTQDRVNEAVGGNEANEDMLPPKKRGRGRPRKLEPSQPKR